MTDLKNNTLCKKAFDKQGFLEFFKSSIGKDELDLNSIIDDLKKTDQFAFTDFQDLSDKGIYLKDFETFNEFEVFSRFFKQLLANLNLKEEILKYQPSRIPSLESLKYRGNNNLNFKRSKISHSLRFEGY